MPSDENICAMHSDSHFWVYPKAKTLQVALLEGTLNDTDVQMLHLLAPPLWLWRGVEHPAGEATPTC